MHLGMVDEHYYRTPQWFLDNLNRYDQYDRGKSAVYLGEYAAHEKNRRTTLRSALAEAAYLTHVERNGDIVQLSSYAPLLGKIGRTQWNPNLIYFSNSQVYPTINYYVQQLFSTGSGDTYLPAAATLPISVVRDTSSGDTFIKLVNTEDEPRRLQLDLGGVDTFAKQATCTVLTGPLLMDNNAASNARITPRMSELAIGTSVDYAAPEHSLTVIHLRRK